MKVTVVGAGNVGATAANVIASAGYASEVVLLDIKEGVSEGKAMDMMQTSQILNFDTTITGVTNDYAATAGSKVVVITSGIPRKPGMSREDLIGVNAGIVGSVIEQAVKYSPDAIFIVISNPMDAMTYLALKNSGLPKNHVIGMGGMLDISRFRYYLSQSLKKKCIPVSHFLDEAELEDAIAQTKVGGATLTKLLGTSAWYAPGAAAGELVKSIITDGKKLIPCCVYLEGEYGEDDLCIGVPVILGENGVEQIVELKLEGVEKERFAESVAAARNTQNNLGDALKK